MIVNRVNNLRTGLLNDQSESLIICDVSAKRNNVRTASDWVAQSFTLSYKYNAYSNSQT